MSLTDDLKSIPHLLGDVAEQVAKLVQNEVLLAKTELSDKLDQASRGAAFLGVAAVVAIPVLVMLLITFALWLSQLGLNPVVAHLLATLVGAGISVTLGFVGLSLMKDLKPKVTIREVKRDVDTAKELAK